VAWGGLLGIALVAERAVARAKLYKALPGRVKVLLTFILIVLTWVVFRSPSLPDAGRYLASLVGLSSLDSASVLFPGVLLTPLTTLALLLGGAIVIWGRPSQDLVKEPSWRGMALATAVLACALAVVFQQSFRPFLYSVF
jgi:alginate O-acetyltransferase complex protein AlgI